MPATWHRLLTPRYCHLFDRRAMCFFSRTTHNHIRLLRHNLLFVVYNTALANKNPRSLTSWTYMGYDEEGTYSFSRACHNHWWIVTTGARYLGQSITGWHLAPYDHLHVRINTLKCLCCCQRGLHCVLMWQFGHPLLWHVCFIWIEFVIIYSYSDKLPVASIYNTINLSLRSCIFFSAM